MSNGGDLLRMLMPAVRPVPTEGARPGKPPIESQSFDTLLHEARQTEPNPALTAQTLAPASPTDPTRAADPTPPTDGATKADTLAPLSGLDSIHNASLRRLIAETNGR